MSDPVHGRTAPLCATIVVVLALLAVAGCQTEVEVPDDLVPDDIVVDGVDEPPEPDEEEVPRSVAALGDSITAASNLDLERLAAENPAYSWATGDAIESVHARLVELDPGAAGGAHNLAVPGARIAGLPAQADEAAALDVDLVIVLMGANDACASAVDAMTSVADFERDLGEALDRIEAGLPEGSVHLLSIPDVTRLWDILGDRSEARLVWERFGICQAALSSERSDEDRSTVRDRVAAYNEVTADLCDARERCTHDDGIVFDHRYEADHVSPADFFHPSEDGQRTLAEMAWETLRDR